ncbi:MAG: M48 family metallopeptidase [Gemmatimonadota bacterium]|nr:M48 family metallopeptidase [Gemmatimonadota bacterium]
MLIAGVAACSVSQDQEIAMGTQDAQEINAQLPIVHDPQVEAYLNALGDSIAQRTSRADLGWHFFLVNTNEINAFALPGGFVYVNRGLVERTDRLDELAGVLGHEIGHVTRRHAVTQMQSQQKAQIGVALLCTLTKVCQHPSAQVVIQAGGATMFARHSRRDETEADEEGVANVVRAGIDPHGIPEFFQKLLEERKRRPTIVDAWFASHPLEESRIADTQRLISAIDPAKLSGLATDAPSFHAFKDRVRSLPAPARAASGASTTVTRDSAIAH